MTTITRYKWSGVELRANSQGKAFYYFLFRVCFNNRELVTTIKELDAIAAAAHTGDNSTPYLGNKTPAASGIVKTL